MTVAPWTILSSRAAIASGRCLPSAFGYVRSAGRERPVRSAVDPCVQIGEPWPEIRLVVDPRHAIDTRCRPALQRVERHKQRVWIDVVEECGEPFLLPLPCCFSYAVQRLGHALPDLRPMRALPVRVPLGPRPLLHRLLG